MGPLRSQTDDEALVRLAWAGLDEETIMPDPLKQAEQNRFAVNNNWLARNPDKPLAVFIRTGTMPKRRSEPAPIVDPHGIRTLRQAGPQWAADKRECDDAPSGSQKK